MMFDRSAHAWNGEQDVAVFLAPLPNAPQSWRPEGSTGVWMTIPGNVDMTFSVSPPALEMAKERGRVLIVEVGEDGNRETWVSLDA